MIYYEPKKKEEKMITLYIKLSSTRNSYEIIQSPELTKYSDLPHCNKHW